MKQHRIRIGDSNVMFILDGLYLYIYVENTQYKVVIKNICIINSNYILFGAYGPSIRLSGVDVQHIEFWKSDMTTDVTIFLKLEDFVILKAKLKEWKIPLD